MRIFNNHPPAAAEANPLPFAGLGFDTECIQAAAGTMIPVRCRPDSAESCPAVPVLSWQPCGYELLVTLGREIRGR